MTIEKRKWLKILKERTIKSKRSANQQNPIPRKPTRKQIKLT